MHNNMINYINCKNNLINQIINNLYLKVDNEITRFRSISPSSSMYVSLKFYSYESAPQSPYGSIFHLHSLCKRLCIYRSRFVFYLKTSVQLTEIKTLRLSSNLNEKECRAKLYMSVANFLIIHPRFFMRAIHIGTVVIVLL